jgi:hypothetical protein
MRIQKAITASKIDWREPLVIDRRPKFAQAITAAERIKARPIGWREPDTLAKCTRNENRPFLWTNRADGHRCFGGCALSPSILDLEIFERTACR